MTKDECQELVVQAYASYNLSVPENDRKSIMRAWYDIVHDLEYEMAKQELLNIVAVSPFMPKPGDIRRAYINSHNKIAQQPTPQVAWAIVMDVIKSANSGVQYQDPIPEGVSKTMKLLGETLYGLSGVYDQQNFMKTYEAVVNEIQLNAYRIPEK